MFLFTHALCYAMLIQLEPTVRQLRPWHLNQDRTNSAVLRPSKPLEAALERAVPSDVSPGQQGSQVQGCPKTIQNLHPMDSMTTFPH